MVQHFLELGIRCRNLVSPLVTGLLGRIDEALLKAKHGVTAFFHATVCTQVVVGMVCPGIIRAQAASGFDQHLVAIGDLTPSGLIELALLSRTWLVNAGEDDVLGDLVETDRLVDRR